MADVLIVDDDVDLATTLGEVLHSEGHRTRVAFNGLEGLAAMEEWLPDVLLLDVEMPVLDGPSMAYRMLVHDAGRERVPIIVSSGYADIDAVAERIGTPYRIQKPCSLEALRRVVARAATERHPPRPAGSVP